MKLRFEQVFFLVFGFITSVSLYGAHGALLARYGEVRILRDAATNQAERAAFDAQLTAIANELASAQNDAPVGILPIQKEPSVANASSIQDDLEERKIILATKLDTVFKNFIHKDDLDSHGIVLAETMKHWFIVSMEQFYVAPQAVQAEIIVFVEMARVLLCRMQLLVGSPVLIKTLFGDLPIAVVDKKRMSDLFVKALYESTFLDGSWKVLVNNIQQAKMNDDEIVKYVRGAFALVKPWPLVSVLVKEGVITNAWRLDYSAYRTSRRMLGVFNVIFSSHLIDLMQQFINLEKSLEMVPDLKSLQKEAFVSKFVLDADTLISTFLKEHAPLQQQNDRAAIWARLFIGKTILLKQAMLLRVQIARGGKYEKIRRDVYVKNDVLAQDPLFNEVIFVPELSGYVSRYETIVTNFLMGKTDPAIDFYRDHQMLLAHLRSLVAKITPQGWRSYVYGVSGKGVYAALFNGMISILEDIGRALQYGDSMFGAAQGFVADLLSDKGLLAGLGGKELQAGIIKLGLKPEQVKMLLEGATGNPKELVLQLLAHASPLLLNGIVQYVSHPVPDKPVLGEVKIARSSPQIQGVVKLEASSDLVQQIEDKAPGLLDLLVRHMKAELNT